MSDPRSRPSSRAERYEVRLQRQAFEAVERPASSASATQPSIIPAQQDLPPAFSFDPSVSASPTTSKIHAESSVEKGVATFIAASSEPVPSASIMSLTVASARPIFEGKDAAYLASDFLSDFEAYILDRNLSDADDRTVKYFAVCLRGDAKDWFDKQPDDIKASFPDLQKAFKDRFELADGVRPTVQTRFADFIAHLGPSLDIVRNAKQWDEWLTKLVTLAGHIPRHEVSDSMLAYQAWSRLPTEVRRIVTEPGSSVANLVRTCRARPRSDYEQVLEIHDEFEKLREFNREREQEQQERPDKQRRYQAYQQQQLQRMPLTPPQEQQQWLPAPSMPAPFVMNPQSQRQPLQLPYYPALPPSPPGPRFVELRQLTYPDTAEGRAAYDSAMREYRQRHPRMLTQPSIKEPYPLTPGTEAAGTTECHRCGHRGHKAQECRGAPVPQPEQNYRRQYGQAMFAPRRENV
jgi:hypothetical protein